MKKIELLAPAGNMRSLKVAIEAGCDAVYIGGYAYSARGFADNFSNEELIEAISYSHLYGVKVYVTVNTLIYDDEVETFLNYIDFLHKNSVDALIIQDLGMFDLVRKTYPNLELHASTQMHIHNVEGAKFAKKYGMKRVVLARETSIDTIFEIKKNVDIDLEVFCHGALCVSYSGQCLMSSLIGSRSGNRGVCAGTCRLPYDLVEICENKQTVLNKDKYLLSMKDLNTLENIGQLIDLGVTSLKIEGRMKREEYIYLVVSIYRKAIDSYYKNGRVLITEDDILELKKIFNRNFTKGFLFNEENKKIINQFRPNHQGIKIGTVVSKNKDEVFIKLTDDICQNDGIRIINNIKDAGCQLNYIYKNNKLVNSAKKNEIISVKISDQVDIGDIVLKTTDSLQLKKISDAININSRKVKINGFFEAKVGFPMKISLNDGLNNIVLESDCIVESAKTNPISLEQIEHQLKKLGSTIYEFNKLSLNIDDNIFLSIKAINELRRKACEQLNNVRIYKIEYQKNNYEINVPSFNRENNLNFFIKTEEQYTKIKNKQINNIYIDDYNLFIKLKNDNRIVYKLPRVIDEYIGLKNSLLIGEIGSLKYSSDNEIMTDFSFNVTNSYTVAFLHSLGVKKITLSFELNDDQIKKLIDNYKARYLNNPNLELIVFGKEEMMISKFNLLKMYNKEYCNNIYLKDRYNKLYKILEKDNLMYIYNCKERNLLDNIKKYYEIGINNLRINILDDLELDNYDLSKM